MPSPVGHALAGAAAAWAMGPRNAVRPEAPGAAAPRTWRTVTLVCAALAALPDIDLLTPWFHRTVTHSVGAVSLVFILATAVTGWVTPPWRARIVAACTVAYATHLALDWMGIDRYPPYGLMALWPLSHRWFISGWDVFAQTARFHLLSPETMLINLRAVAREIMILGPVAAAVVLARRFL